jgi:translation initiation factor IF-2
MTDQTEKPKLGTRPPLGLKRTVETGKVKQSFSHGRSNTVVVERKQRRVFSKPGEAPVEAPKAPVPVAEAPKPAPKPAAPAPAPAPRKLSQAEEIAARKEMQAKLLREAEEARLNSLEEARRRDDHSARKASEDEKRRAEENRKAEEAAAEEAARAAEEAQRAPEVAAEAPPAVPVDSDDEERGFRRPGHAPAPKRPEPSRPTRGREDRRHSGKLTVSRALSGEDDSRARSLAALRRAREKEKRHHQQAGPAAKQYRDVDVPEAITVQELAKRMGERGADLVKALF